MPKNIKTFGKGGFGQGDLADPIYLKDTQRSRIINKLEVIENKLNSFKKIIDLLEQQLNNIKNKQ